MWYVSVRCSVSGRMFAAGTYKQDVYMYMSYVEALIWKGIYSACYEGPWVNGCGQ